MLTWIQAFAPVVFHYYELYFVITVYYPHNCYNVEYFWKIQQIRFIQHKS